MEKSDRKLGKVFLIFAGICIVVLPLIVFSAFSSGPQEMKTETTDVQTRNMDFDNNGKAIFVNYDQISKDYLEGTSTARTLDEFYSRRQYPGSPPFIPHKVEEPDLAAVDCLACHARGGWTEELKKNTPVTPHPEREACRQCHVTLNEVKLFVETNWMSVAPPRLGRAALPGAPPPIPHDILMRGNCIACHVGPGTVAAIRVEHPSRGNCRQCHVPQTHVPLFERKPKS